MERKTETLNLRVTPEVKNLVKRAAEQQRRTISNFVEVLVREHCERVDLEPVKKQPKPR